MSKLRADITWNNRSKSSSPTPLNSAVDIDDNNENVRETKNVENSSSKEESEEEDLTNLEDEFDKYLEGWAEMLEEEFFNDFDTPNEEDEIVPINDTTHPAVDPSAKWDLRSLFKELEMPFK